VDAAGNAYVSGVTTNTQSSVSNDFPIVNAYDATFSGYDAAFLFKLNASGSALLYSTYLGDSDPNIAREVAVDRASGEAYVVADSASGNCPTPTGGTQPCDGSLVAKFNSAGNALVYAFIIDRSSAGYDIAVDPAGSAYVTGSTLSDFFPVTPGAYQRVCTGCNLGRSDAYVVKLNPQGTNFVYATYLGGSQGDSGYSIAADNSGNAYVTGNTGSSSATTKPFPTTPGAYQTEGNSGSVFVTKLNASGSALLYSTYFGGNVREEARGIAVDSFGNVYFTGYTRSLNFPTANPVQPTPTQSGTSYVFVSALDASGAGLLFSTFLGVGEGNYIAADSSGNVYVTGETFSDSFPTTPGAFQTANARTSGNGGNSTSLSDAFVSKIAIGNPTPTYRISGTITNNTDNASDLTVTLSGTQNRTTTARLGANSTFIFAFDGLPAGGNYTVTPSKLNYTFDPPSRSFTNLSGSQTADFRAIPTPPNVSVNDVVVTEGDAGTVSATFRVTRSVPRGGDTVVDLDTADGTATAGSDYTATTLRLIFSGGQTEQLVTVPVISDTIAESDETFFVNLTSITNATIVDSQGIGTIVNDDGGTPTPAPSTSGLQYYALPTPVRLLDTRPGQPACVNSGTALAANGIRTEAARTPCTGIPATAKAIVGNATVVAPTDGGYITLYPSGAAQPTVSNLNFVSRQVVPNSFTVGVGAGDGAFNIYASASTHFIVDVTGYYAPPGQGGLFYHPLPRPVRLLDTRNGQQACDTPNSPLTAGGTRTETARLICSGVTIPVSAQAVVGNATVVSQSGGEGYITLFPSGANQPTVSNLNFVQGQVVPNSFTVGLGSDGAFNIYTSAATDFIVDIAGYYSTDPAPDVNGVAGLLYYPLTAPVRLLDTRSGQPACDTPNASLATNSTRTQVARRTCSGQSVPTNAQAVVGNATVVNGTQNGGYITLFPSGAAQPNVSNLNFVGGQVVPNSFTVRLGGDGAFNIYTSSSTDFIVDLAGYFAP